MIIDSHAHYDDEAFEEDRETLLNSFHENGIEYVINSSASMESVKSTLELMEKFPFIYGTLGIHPNDAAELNEEKFKWLKEQYQKDKVVAVGEIGLDYYWDEPDASIQKEWFSRQMELAREIKLPIVVHSRDAAKDTLDMLKAHHAGEIGGEIHCFSYGVEMAREFLNMGFYIGVGGIVTFKNAKKLVEVVEYMPLDRILLETDCPYLAPTPNRGQRNTSLNLTYIAKEIANIKGIDYDEVVAVTSQNTKTLFQIK